MARMTPWRCGGSYEVMLHGGSIESFAAGHAVIEVRHTAVLIRRYLLVEMQTGHTRHSKFPLQLKLSGVTFRHVRLLDADRKDLYAAIRT
jgi:hypothetical protein